MSVELDARIRRYVYESACESGRIPTIAETSSTLRIGQQGIRNAFESLAAARMLVVKPDGEILMAEPFSAVPTPFLVEVAGFSCYGNCIWDALGIAAMLKQETRIKTACPDCEMALQLNVAGGQVTGDSGVAHFAVPARDWWRDVVFT